MGKSTENILKIVEAGGSVIIDSTATSNLIRIVETARMSGAHVTIKGNTAVDNQVKIAEAGRGHVTFDLT